MERRKFIRLIGTVGTAFVVLPQLLSCDDKRPIIKTKILGANKDRGHLIRNNQLKKQNKSRVIAIDTVIVGGGVTGLSAAYHLSKRKKTDFVLLELNEHVGGNSDSGNNEFSQFPLGAHYLTLPNSHNRPLIEFLKLEGLITKENSDGTQEYSEANLCHAPDERLLLRGTFQEGLVPNYGVKKESLTEIDRFFALMNEFKQQKDAGGKYLFDIPLIEASEDPILKKYDQQTFLGFLKENDFYSEELYWFLDYCCRDDFGAGFDRVSAWAGINYFAGRKSNPSNTIPSNVLTWPEGNGNLVQRLKKQAQNYIQTDTIVYEIQEKEDGVNVTSYNIKTHETLIYQAKKVIVCCPSYVTKHILKSPFWVPQDFDGYIHHPWLVTTVVLKEIPEAGGLELAWDNVKYGTKGLGYIYNQNQSYDQLKSRYVLSVYLALDKQGDVEERNRLFGLTEEEMKELVLLELKGLHPTIEDQIESMEFQQWGHGMVTPYPASLQKHYDFKVKNEKSPRIRLAHTDYSGYSIFEEGFSQGEKAANFVLNSVL